MAARMVILDRQMLYSSTRARSGLPHWPLPTSAVNKYNKLQLQCLSF